MNFMAGPLCAVLSFMNQLSQLTSMYYLCLCYSVMMSAHTHTYIPLNNRCKANNTPINTHPSKHVHTLGWVWKVIILPLLSFLWRSHDKQSLLSKCRHLSAPKKMLSGADNVQMLNCIMCLYHM